MTDEDTQKDIAKKLADKNFRMSTLYQIKNKHGKVVTFKANNAQQHLLDNYHNRNVIPKARQRGISTVVDIHILDECLFNSHMKASIIAHRESDALKLFASKILFPYQHIPEFLIDAGFVPRATRMTSSTIEFDNGSIITADTMVRSDTLQILHISELAKMYAQFPQKAEEVKTGALPAVEKGTVFIESTMEGRFGLMFDISEKAQEIMLMELPLTEKDFKFFFFPWWDCKEYRLEHNVDIEKSMEEYFDGLEENDGIVLDDAQKAWYVKENDVQGDKMKQEYPATYRESTEVATNAMFFGQQVVKARKEGRVCNVPYDSHALVYCAMDIGRTDSTAIWVFQIISNEIHFIDYYERNGEEPAFYDAWLRSLPYPNSGMGLPHDSEAERMGAAKSTADIFRHDLHRDVTVIPRDAHEIFGINEARSAFNQCWFDRVKCKRGLECVDKFRKEWDEKHCCYRTKSVHDEYSDGAKGFIYSIQYANKLRRRGRSMNKEEYRALKKRHRKVI